MKRVIFIAVIASGLVAASIIHPAHAGGASEICQNYGATPQHYGDPDQTQICSVYHPDDTHTTRTCTMHKFGDGMGWETDCDED